MKRQWTGRVWRTIGGVGESVINEGDGTEYELWRTVRLKR